MKTYCNIYDNIENVLQIPSPICNSSILTTLAAGYNGLKTMTTYICWS